MYNFPDLFIIHANHRHAIKEESKCVIIANGMLLFEPS